MILWARSVEVGVVHVREVWQVGTWEEEERKLGISAGVDRRSDTGLDLPQGSGEGRRLCPKI